VSSKEAPPQKVTNLQYNLTCEDERCPLNKASLVSPSWNSANCIVIEKKNYCNNPTHTREKIRAKIMYLIISSFPS